MTILQHSHPFSVPLPRPVPPLRSGDRLSVAEFERRYQAMPDQIKAELIEGVVHMASPVTDDFHGGPQFDFNTLLGIYRFNTPGVRGGDNSTVKGLQGANQPQPDGHLCIAPECGGQTKRDDLGYIVGAPELLAEIAYSSVSIDLHDKKDVYHKNGVQEYVVWRVEDAALDWFRLLDGEYVNLPLTDGVYKSQAFPGLWVDAQALLTGDYQRLQAVLHEGLNSSEHRQFVARLAAARQTP